MRLTVFCAALLLALPAVAVEKFALGVYHFNVQYVQGGLIGFVDGHMMTPGFNLDDAQVQDLIVTESLDPLLDLFARHPTWGCDIEMQGYMLDIIVQRHPQTLAKLKALAAAGKVAIDSFHWSDQFWLAYPRGDMERSHDLTVKSFQDAQLPLGTTIFSQEGQFAIGAERFMKERGIKSAIVSGGVLGYSYEGTRAKALYNMGGSNDLLAVIGGAGLTDDLVEVTWDWHDDGERTMTGGHDAGLNPYVGAAFVYHPVESAAFEKQLVDEETAGFKHVSVTEYLQQALALGEKPEPLPDVIDGVWHHDAFLWMGSTSSFDLAVPGSSADNEVLTGVMKARRKLLQAEAAVKTVKLHMFDSQIDQSWKDILLAEGSDATGQNPWIGERLYSQQHSKAALDSANQILSDPRVATFIKPAPVSPKLSDDPGPFSLVGDPTAHRVPHVRWEKRSGADIWELTVTWDAITDDPNDPDRYKVQVAFPRTGDDLIWCGALEDQTIRTVALSKLSGTDVKTAAGTETLLEVPAANGLVGIGGDTYVIKRTETVHVAALFPKAEKVVRFRDDTALTSALTWKFIVVKGTQAAALAEATAANIDPEPLKLVGCGCNTSAADGGVLLLGLLGTFMRRRGRRA